MACTKKQETCRTSRHNSHFLFLFIYDIPVSVIGVSDGSVLLRGEGVWCAWEAWPQPRVLGGQAGGVCRRIPAHHCWTWTQVSSQTLSAVTDVSTSYNIWRTPLKWRLVVQKAGNYGMSQHTASFAIVDVTIFPAFVGVWVVISSALFVY